MSDVGPELIGDDALAAEHALGVLSAPERAAAEARMASDPAFAREVEAWRERLAPLIDEVPPAPPSAGLWASIERALPANDDVADLRRSVSTWRRASFGAFGLMAASLAAVVVLASRPPEVIVQPAPAAGQLMSAQLSTEGGQQLFVAAYDPDRKALVITSLAPPEAHPGKVHELWLIPADGKPRSLGIVERGVSKAVPMTAMAPMAREGAKLAISVEPP
ncbi:anti-sigma factor, partial [Phenylobacterium sp.]|uniref:anti-sigma factor n=1 Tax=Phenylobacterium sp. TaxID=1871053 RepID=UPI002E324BDF